MFLNTPAQKPVPSPDCSAADITDRKVRRFIRLAHGWLLVCFLTLDRRLRQILKIIEFSERTDCILRFAYARSRNNVQLGDGSEIRKGDRIIELHLWNEHLSMRRNPSRSLGNAAELRRRLSISFQLLGEQIATDPRSEEIKGCHARIVLNFRGREPKLIAVARHYGFECVSSSSSLPQRSHDLLENFLIYSLIWAFNRQLLRRSVGRLSRADLWMSRKQFLALYGHPLFQQMPCFESASIGGGNLASEARAGIANSEAPAVAPAINLNSRPRTVFEQKSVDHVPVYETSGTTNQNA